MNRSLNTLFAIALGSLLAATGVSKAAGPTAKKVATDVTAHWKTQWPDQPVAHVEKKTDCEKAELDDPARKDKSGKPKKIQTCLIKADVFVAKGYRLLIYRDTFVHYVGAKLKAVLLGELEKTWKAGGVPSPSAEQVTAILSKLAVEKLQASEPKIQIVELGRPRPHGDFFRVTMVVNLTFQKDGAEKKLEKALATLQSDGGDWMPAPELTF